MSGVGGPTPSAGVAAADEKHQQPYWDGITAVLTKYCPDKLGTLDATMAKFKYAPHLYYKTLLQQVRHYP